MSEWGLKSIDSLAKFNAVMGLIEGPDGDNHLTLDEINNNSILFSNEYAVEAFAFGGGNVAAANNEDEVKVFEHLASVFKWNDEELQGREPGLANIELAAILALAEDEDFDFEAYRSAIIDGESTEAFDQQLIDEMGKQSEHFELGYPAKHEGTFQTPDQSSFTLQAYDGDQNASMVEARDQVSFEEIYGINLMDGESLYKNPDNESYDSDYDPEIIRDLLNFEGIPIEAFNDEDHEDRAALNNEYMKFLNMAGSNMAEDQPYVRVEEQTDSIADVQNPLPGEEPPAEQTTGDDSPPPGNNEAVTDDEIKAAFDLDNNGTLEEDEKAFKDHVASLSGDVGELEREELNAILSISNESNAAFQKEYMNLVLGKTQAVEAYSQDEINYVKDIYDSYIKDYVKAKTNPDLTWKEGQDLTGADFLRQAFAVGDIVDEALTEEAASYAPDSENYNKLSPEQQKILDIINPENKERIQTPGNVIMGGERDDISFDFVDYFLFREGAMGFTSLIDRNNLEERPGTYASTQVIGYDVLSEEELGALHLLANTFANETNTDTYLGEYHSLISRQSRGAALGFSRIDLARMREGNPDGHCLTRNLNENNEIDAENGQQKSCSVLFPDQE